MVEILPSLNAPEAPKCPKAAWTACLFLHPVFRCVDHVGLRVIGQDRSVFGARLLRLEEEDGAVTKVEVDEVLRLCEKRQGQLSYCCLRSELLRTVRNEAAKVAADDAMPGWALSVVELQRGRRSVLPNAALGTAPTYSLLNVLRNVLVDVSFPDATDRL